MPTQSRPENTIITLFVSAFEGGAWKNSKIFFPDEEEDSGIDGLAINPNKERLAIEHTVIEPFLGDIMDQKEMIPMFPEIEQDASLTVPELWVQVFVPVGTMHLQKLPIRRAISTAIREWLRGNRLSLPLGDSQHTCSVSGIPNAKDFDINLTVKVYAIESGGSINVRRQQVEDTLGDVVEKMLAKKLPKLVKTPAQKRILILERQHVNLSVQRIYAEIEQRITMFPELTDVHEIWIAEKIPFFQPTAKDVRFEHYRGGHLVQSYDFRAGMLQKYS